MPTVSSRDRILLSARRLFARNGYENTSTVAIAREAGTSESQLMKHFGSKQGLLGAIFDYGWAAVMQRAETGLGSASPAERLYKVLEAMVVELESEPELKDLMMLEARRVRKDNRDVLMSRGYQQFAATIDGLLAEMRSVGQMREGVRLDAARAGLIGMMEGLVRDQVVAKRSELRADYNFDDIRKLLGLVLSALGTVARPLQAVNQ